MSIFEKFRERLAAGRREAARDGYLRGFGYAMAMFHVEKKAIDDIEAESLYATDSTSFDRGVLDAVFLLTQQARQETL